VLATRENFPLLAELLADQQRLDTPAARFSRAYEQDAAAENLGPQLIPLSAPGPGEQYAFEVDLDSCTGCKSCVAACHSLNGLDDTETWRDVGQLVGTNRRHPFSQTITTACHHCEDPGCLNGCPVLAYEKDPITGIVRHLDDQCIGCSYCILKCPYDVPKYSSRLGIVRKCDMCHGRLAHGEAPACAQSCPTSAIKIVTVEVSHTAAKAPDARRRATTAPGASDATEPAVVGIASTTNDQRQTVPGAARAKSEIESRKSQIRGFLPATPDPSYTRPTTRYVTARTFPDDLIAADAAALRPQPAHWPLVVLLMFMPMAIGCGIADKSLALPSPILAVMCWLSGAIGLAFSIGHLGQPTRAWRIFLGLRRSWLSREAVVFGLWFPLATAYTALRLGWLHAPALQAPLALATAVAGILGLFCSVMIYADTHRSFWRFAHTAPRFFGSAAVLGLGSACAVTLLGSAADALPRAVPGVLMLAMFVKLMLESQALAPLNGDRDTLTPALKTAQLLAGPLRSVNELRIACGALGGLLIPALLALRSGPTWLAWPGLVLIVVGEFLERSLFFRAVDAPKMPGVAG
jgi:formate dehydrogenase iron-sulfur subunit